MFHKNKTQETTEKEEYRCTRKENNELKRELDDYGKGKEGVSRELKKTQEMNKRMCSALKNMATVENRTRQEADLLRVENSDLRRKLQQTNCVLQKTQRKLSQRRCGYNKVTSCGAIGKVTGRGLDGKIGVIRTIGELRRSPAAVKELGALSPKILNVTLYPRQTFPADLELENCIAETVLHTF
ncbi:hypothetical protein AAG570_009763 [Ranatra chinensis]|uniref:Uncharacterized protein n=1 Tax=Ranatra chinensis TaxID=642074 RepID=A0ABD0ZB49_9HEMI